VNVRPLALGLVLAASCAAPRPRTIQDFRDAGLIRIVVNAYQGWYERYDCAMNPGWFCRTVIRSPDGRAFVELRAYEPLNGSALEEAHECYYRERTFADSIDLPRPMRIERLFGPPEYQGTVRWRTGDAERICVYKPLEAPRA